MNNNLKLGIKIFILLISLHVNSICAQVNDAIVTNLKTQIKIESNKLIKLNSYEILVNNKNGEDYCHIAIPFSKLNRVSKLEAYIKDKNGLVVRKLKNSDITERSMMQDFSFYEDNFVREFTLLHTDYPYTLFYQFQEESNEFLFIDSWTPVIDTHIPTTNAILTLDIPKDYKISYKSNLIDNFKVDTLTNNYHFTWKASFSKEFESEIFSPSLNAFFPKVEIVPLKFRFDKEGSFELWKTYGNWQYKLLSNLSELSTTEKAKIDALINGIVSPKEKIKLLYHYLQDATRYVNISIDKGGLKPTSAMDVCENKYGDCKALTNYFKAVLSYVGIPSFYSNIYATNVSEAECIKKIDKNFPSQQFNHVILCVPLKIDTLWLDCTSKKQFNYLGTFTQNRETFLIDKDNSHFLHTPALRPKDVCTTRNIQVKCDLADKQIAFFHVKYKGEKFEILSNLSTQMNENDKSLYIRNKFLDGANELIEFKISQAHRDSDFIFFDYHAKYTDLTRQYGDELLFRIIPFKLPLFKEPKYRKLTVQIDYPICKVDTINYSISSKEYSIIGIPENQTIHSRFGDYKVQFMRNQNEIQVVKSFLLNSGDYNLQEYIEFYEFMKKVYDIEQGNYLITKNNIK